MLKYLLNSGEALSEKQLIEGCLKGKLLYQKQLYERFADKMFAVCYRYAGDYHLAEDILQEGFMAIFQNLHQFRFEGSFEGWIRRIISHTAIRLIKTKLSLSFNDFENSEEEMEQVSIDNDVLSRLSAKELEAMIESMPIGYRAVFNLFVLEEYNHSEIARELNISESTSRSQLARAKKYLQEKIQSSHGYKLVTNF